MLEYTLDTGAYAPKKAHLQDAGYDLKTPVACNVPAKIMSLVDNVFTQSGGSTVIDTGVHVTIPEGYVGFLKSKSGLNVFNNIVSEGVIDAGYTGSIVVKLYNHGPFDHKFEAGDKITQLVILPIKIEYGASEIESELTRGDDGFGSSGK